MNAEQLAKHLNLYINREVHRLVGTHAYVDVVDMGFYEYGAYCEQIGLQKLQAFLWGLTSDDDKADNGNS